MPTTYEDGDFTSPQQHGDVVVQRPLAEVGDPGALVIVRPMMVNRVNYSAPTVGDALSGFSSSRYLFPRNFRDVSNDVMEYEEVYATVPADRANVLSGSNSFPFPAYQGVVFTPPATAKAAETEGNLWKFIELRGANNNPAPLFISYNYFVEGSMPTVPDVFRPTYNGAAVDFVTDGGGGSGSNVKALNGDTFSYSFSVSASSPSQSAYALKISSGEKINVDVRIERYLGDIFVLKTFKMTAQ